MRALRTAGWAVLAVLVPAWLAVVEVLWLPLRLGAVPIPVSVLAAAVGNLLLVTWAHRLSGSRVVGLLPAVTWAVIALGASQRRPEGDLLITGQTTATQLVGLAFLLVGVLFASFAVGRLLSRPAAAGSGSGGAR